MAIINQIEIPIDTGRVFDVKAGVVLRDGPGTQYPVHYKTTTVSKYRLIGFHRPSDWVFAENPANHGQPAAKSAPFFVPPSH